MSEQLQKIVALLEEAGNAVDGLTENVCAAFHIREGLGKELLGSADALRQMAGAPAPHAAQEPAPMSLRASVTSAPPAPPASPTSHASPAAAGLRRMKVGC